MPLTEHDESEDTYDLKAEEEKLRKLLSKPIPSQQWFPEGDVRENMLKAMDWMKNAPREEILETLAELEKEYDKRNAD